MMGLEANKDYNTVKQLTAQILDTNTAGTSTRQVY